MQNVMWMVSITVLLFIVQHEHAHPCFRRRTLHFSEEIKVDLELSHPILAIDIDGVAWLGLFNDLVRNPKLVEDTKQIRA